MVDDIIFHSNYFFLELPSYSSGVITSALEWDAPDSFQIRLALPERISIG